MTETWVSLLASWKGAEVYPNLNSTGPSDLVMVVEGKTYHLDVKLARPGSKGGWFGNTNLVKDPVIPVLVIPLGDISEWKVKWITNRFPSELKDFWSRSHTPFTFKAA